jgi:hypothetical protein
MRFQTSCAAKPCDATVLTHLESSCSIPIELVIIALTGDLPMKFITTPTIISSHWYPIHIFLPPSIAIPKSRKHGHESHVLGPKQDSWRVSKGCKGNIRGFIIEECQGCRSVRTIVLNRVVYQRATSHRLMLTKLTAINQTD